MAIVNWLLLLLLLMLVELTKLVMLLLRGGSMRLPELLRLLETTTITHWLLLLGTEARIHDRGTVESQASEWVWCLLCGLLLLLLLLLHIHVCKEAAIVLSWMLLLLMLLGSIRSSS